jgi:zinc protease
MYPKMVKRMKKPYWMRPAAMLLLWLLPFFPLAQAQPALPNDPDVRTGKLPNGMTYYVRRNVEPANRAELRLAVNAGSVLEDDDQQGLAHFCEHMAFNGSTHFKKSELVDALEAMGVKFGPHLNAYTSFDETVYMLQVPTDKPELIDKAMLVLEDWAQGLSFDNNEIDKERGVVIEEWRLRSGAMTRTMQELIPTMVSGAKYADRTPIGKVEILKNFKYEAVKNFYAKWYRPDLMAVILVGDIDPVKMEQELIQRFSKVPTKPNPTPRPFIKIPDHEDVRAKVFIDDESQFNLIQVLFKHDNLPYKTEADFHRDLILSLASGMLTDRLAELKETGNSPYLFSFVGDGNLQGIRAKSAMSLFGIFNADGADKAIDQAFTEIERARRHGFIASEYERQRTKMLKGAETAFKERDKTGSDQLIGEYVNSFLDGSYFLSASQRLDLLKKHLPEISLDQVNAAYRSAVQPRNCVITLSGKEGKSSKFPTDAALLAKFESVLKADVEPYKEVVDDRPLIGKQPITGKVVSTTTDAKWGLTEWKLSNGARVILKPTTFKDDEVQMTAVSLGGSSRLSNSDLAKAWAATEIVSLSGVGPFKASVLTKKLADKTVSVTPYMDTYLEGVQASAGKADLETMLQLTYLYFTAPRQDKEAFESFKQSYKSFVGMMGGPEGQFQDSVMVAMAQHHPRMLPLTDARIEAVQLQPAYMAYLDRFMDASDFTFIFVGNFDPAQIQPWIELYIGGLPSVNRKETWKDLGIKAPEGIVKKAVYAGRDPKSMVSLNFTGEFVYSEENIYEMNAMLATLRIMLRESMREEKGGVYGVGANAEQVSFPKQGYKITIGFGCDPMRVDELIATVFEEIKKLQAQGASEKNLQKIQEIDRRSRETDLQDNDWWLNTLERMQLNGIPMSVLEAHDSWVSGLSGSKIAALAKKYLHDDHYVQVVMYPETK